MTPANVEFVRGWIQALRSGLYPQTFGTHRDLKGYCALGVGYDLCPNSEWVPYLDGWIPVEHSVAPQELVKCSGLTVDALLDIAYQLNDSGKPFSKVADHLEQLIAAYPLPQESRQLEAVS